MSVQSLLLGLATFALSGATDAQTLPNPRPTNVYWPLESFTTLVAFGDSWTDECRFSYFQDHNGTAPPVGWQINPENCNQTASGGNTWARDVVNNMGAKIYNYATSGASCSNNLTPRYDSRISAVAPSLTEYEIPAFATDWVQGNATSNLPLLDVPAKSTVYAIWIGVNDLGYNAFIDDSQVAGATLPNVVDCIFNAIDMLYRRGGRFFVLMNIPPLHLAPLYAPPSKGGLAKSLYWQNKPSNGTEVSVRMLEQVSAVNAIIDYRTPYEVQTSKRYPDANFAIFNVSGLMTDLYNNPNGFLQQPANVTGYFQHCDPNGSSCYNAPGNLDSFMWNNEIHPSAATDRAIAAEFKVMLQGLSKYARYWGN